MPQCPQCGADNPPQNSECSYCGATYAHPADALSEAQVLLEGGIGAYKNNQYAAAKQLFEKALELDENLFLGVVHLSNVYHQLGMKDEAIVKMNSARRIKPESAVIPYNLGMLYKSQGRAEEALACFEEALSKIDGDQDLANKGEIRQLAQKNIRELQPAPPVPAEPAVKKDWRFWKKNK